MYDTPKRAELKAIFSLNQHFDLGLTRRQLFDFAGVPRRAGQDILQLDSIRTPRHHDGRPPKLQNDADGTGRIVNLIDNHGFEAARMSWAGMAHEAGVSVDVSSRTVRRHMNQEDIYKFKAAQREPLSPSQAKKREESARKSLEFRSEPEDWRDVRWSDEFHLGFGPEGLAMIARRRGERYRPYNIQRRDNPGKYEENRLHGWIAVGYDFKSDITWYNSKSRNGKLSHQVYISQILEPVVAQWLRDDGPQSFILEEDGDSGHGPSQKNPVRTWKEEHSLRFFFNCPNSPDLSPAENAILAIKAEVRKFGHWDLEGIKTRAVEGWEGLSQKRINDWVDSMPQRLKDVIELEGQMTGW